MKKFFLIAAAAAMVLSSCSKNTVSEDTSAGNAIGFGTYSRDCRLMFSN
jgi:predicted small secreted protein